MARYFAEVGYPRIHMSAETIRRTDACIARTSPPAGLRRLLMEGRDDIARALHCQHRDHQSP
jgi:hypothetical protein